MGELWADGGLKSAEAVSVSKNQSGEKKKRTLAESSHTSPSRLLLLINPSKTS